MRPEWCMLFSARREHARIVDEIAAQPAPSRARRLIGGWAFLITLIAFSDLGVLAPI